MWKTRKFDDILLRQCNAVYSQNRIERWTMGCILPFPKKGDLGLAKNYRGIDTYIIAAKIYNAQLRNHIEPKIDNILRKNQNGFRRNRSTTSHKYWPSVESLKAFGPKNLQATLLFCRLYQGLRFHTQREDGANPTSIRPTKRNRSSDNWFCTETPKWKYVHQMETRNTSTLLQEYYKETH